MRTESFAGAGTACSRLARFLCVLSGTFAVLAFTAASASAAEGRQFEEVFGSTAQPAFTQDNGLATDPASADLLVIDAGANNVSRFKSNGEPDPFSALGTNVIDGSETPQGSFSFGTANEVQVVVAPLGAAAGTAGDIYVTQAGAKLIDVFAADGHYLGQLSEFGATHFSEPCGVTVDEGGNVYVGDFANNKVYRFSPTANPPLNTDWVAGFDGTVEHPCTMAAGKGSSAGSLFVAGFNALSGIGEDKPVSKLSSASGAVELEIDARPTTVAVDPSNGDLLVADRDVINEYSPAGTPKGTPIEPGSTIQGIAVDGGGSLYGSRASFVNVEVYGSLAKSPPQIEAEWGVGIGIAEATLKARFGPEEEETAYHLEYLPQAAFEANGNSFSGPNSPTPTPVPDANVGSAATVAVEVKELQPGTAYRYRFVATNSSGTTEGEDRAFTTYLPLPAPDTNCPNQAFRTAASAFLSDCRAYEMVSPVDKNGGDIVSGLSFSFNPGGYMQVSPDGEKITYTARSSFGDEPNSFVFNQYLAVRQSGKGWSNHGIHPPAPGNQPEDDENQFGALRDFIAFSPDLCSAWLVDFQAPPLTPDGQEGYRNLYRRDNCGPGEGSLEALTPSPPPLPDGTTSIYVDPQSVQGVSEDSRHAIFLARAKLTGDAAESTKTQVYDRFGGGLHLVSVLPGGEPDETGAQVGGGWGANLDRAVSADGSRVYWSSGLGKIYVRQHPEQGVVAGECEPGKACTVPVGEGEAVFWTASADGSKALYSEGNLDGAAADLYEFDLQGAEESPPQPPRLIASDVRGVVGAGEDLSRIYFVSTDKLTGVPNSEGDEARAGQPNLYLEEAGTFSFIATLSKGDVGAAEPGFGEIGYNLVAQLTYFRATRVSADGGRIAFESRSPLTGFDNNDAGSGKPGVEVFTYEAGGALDCVSCNPSGARPSARKLLLPYSITEALDKTGVIAAAWIPTWEHPLHDSNVLSEDGGRLFFNSNDALVLSDTNGAQDVYEWEAPGIGSCDTKDADYFAQNGGCLSLISTGESPIESEFWEASPDGRNVFFTTESSLLPQDPGSIDLYDARVEGGLPQPIVREECEGEACQSPPPAPGYGTPASTAYHGFGNVGPGKRRCPKGERRVHRAGKTRCVKRMPHAKHRQRHQRRAEHNRRAAR
jgi:hypothetical protein